jgi:hypothetical protein
LILPVFHGYRQWQNVNLILHKTPQKKVEVGVVGCSDMEIMEDRKLTVAQKTAIQECCLLTVDVLWFSVMLKKKIFGLSSRS